MILEEGIVVSQENFDMIDKLHNKVIVTGGKISPSKGIKR
jgi:hypothetical protein